MRLSNQIGVTDKVVMADAVRFVFVAPPFITSGPQSQTVVAGQDASFTVNALGADPLSYQWQKNGTSSGRPELRRPCRSLSARFSDAGIYSVTVSNTLGSVTLGNAGLTVLPVEIQSFTALTNGRRRFQMNWAAPETVVEASSNFTNWLELPRLIWTTNLLEVQDPNTNSPKPLLPDQAAVSEGREHVERSGSSGQGF